jgi:hypothetical protein
MSMVSYFKTLGQIEDRVTARMTELRQAERDVALHCNGMACDGATAEDVYRAGLDHIGVSRRETAGLSASALRVLLKNVRAGSHASHAPAMAFDASQDDGKLSSILAGVEPPKNLSTRSDFR